MKKWIKHKGKPAILVSDEEINDIIVKAEKPKRKRTKKKAKVDGD